MALSSGEKLGPYEIVGLIGAGGMGEVYRAIDTRLGRPVAVKFSAKQFSDRFEREARAISALNHPNICTLYDVGSNYLVMEFVDGETLAKMIQKGPLPLDRALSYAIQITDALAAAHAKGVIHRDLKPGNVIVTKSGVKVLDFGLAKLTASGLKEGTGNLSEVVTRTEPITSKGSILGTLHYLSPEQAEGQEATERSDIFSFGAVLYEMVTGQRAFDGASQTGILAAILRDQPPSVTQAQPLAPRSVDRVIRKCLAKDPDDRWHSAHDLKPALELIDLDASAPATTTSSSSHTLVEIPARRPWLWPSVAAFSLLVIAGLTWAMWPKAEPVGHVTRFEVPFPDGAFVTPPNFYLRVSPDGRKLAFTSDGPKGGIWVRDLESVDVRLLPGTTQALAPMWSPDSRSLAFGQGGRLMRVDLAGGSPQVLAESSNTVRSGYWSDRGEIIFGPGFLRRVPQSGGIPTPVTAATQGGVAAGASLPFPLPDGRRFLYRRGKDLYVGSLDVKPDEQSLAKIMASPFGVEFVRDGNSEDGNLFFLRDSTLLAQHFDTKALKLTGDAVPLAQGVASGPQHGHFSVTAGGVLAYRARGTSERQLTWVDRQGHIQKQVGAPRDVLALSLAPDESQVALYRSDVVSIFQGDLWLLDLRREIETRFTVGQRVNLVLVPGTRPVWSRDGKRIAFMLNGDSGGLSAKPANGAGETETLVKEGALPWDFSKDGRTLLYGTDNGNLLALQLGSSGKGEPVKIDGAPENQIGPAALSADNRWIAYTSTASGQSEVFIQAYNAPGEPTRAVARYQVSRNGGAFPRWRGDGKELFFASPDGLVVAQIEISGDSVRASPPAKLFDLAPDEQVLWDVSRDGQRFIVAKRAAGGSGPPITVVENWRATLKK